MLICRTCRSTESRSPSPASLRFGYVAAAAILVLLAATRLPAADRCHLVRDIDVATTTSYALNQVVAVGGICYFTADDGIHGNELWRSDGTTTGTYLVADVNPGSASSVPAQLTPMGDALYFAAYDANFDRELWRSDATTTTRVADINPTGSSDPTLLSAVGNRLYFFADDGVHGSEPWVSDGTSAGTHLITEVNPGPAGSSPGSTYASGFVGMNGAVYFPAAPGASGLELWRTNGTAAGTLEMGDINPGPNSSSPTGLTAVGNQLFFSADDGTHGRGLWATNGTSATTRLVRDTLSGGSPGNPTYLVSFKGFLYFAAVDPLLGNELWRSDGTEGGTFIVKDIAPGTVSSSPYSITVSGSNLYFGANSDPQFVGWEPWKSDGTTSGTVMIKNIVQDNTTFDGSDPDSFTPSGGLVYFYAHDEQHGVELWRTNGTAPGTQMVRDIRPGPVGSQDRPDQHHDIADVAGTLFFFAHDGIHGPQQLWSTRFQVSGDLNNSFRVH